MTKIYFTVTGILQRVGSTDFMERGMKVNLKKDPENKYDKEAIEVSMEGLGRIGYVANSVNTVIGETYSAGRLYDKFGKTAKGTIEYIFPEAAVCCVSVE